ncbi:hypothetical protein A1D18_00080 [Candidatus Rickettsiella isopodorum]|jgi:hypothetical protein|uniref:Uncharacterized protein n=1 Tax=Candidatus Rickettsiella isopodorum TaxID=1225476 RepID=A0A1J8NML9_9COXI|nr:hypothetical protein A1D18_00080 [Candidatus Rickettsiella isopodorum]
MILSNGCEICANFWLKYPKKQPYRLAENAGEQMFLYKCDHCKTYWGADLRTARVLTLEEAKSLFPKYFSRES